jgi:hypothetical protein
MHTCYQDLLDLSDRDPIWFDERAVPRFVLFAPKHIANIYADECVLLEVACQGCDHRFLVAMSTCRSQRVLSMPALPPPVTQAGKGATVDELLSDWRAEWRRRIDLVVRDGALARRVEADEIHYGDPPNVECCPAGPTMNSVPLRVVEFWRRGVPRDWERVPELEVSIDVEWFRDEVDEADLGWSDADEG